jgi:hypothetical protein
VNSDTNFSDSGRTENFDDPWVNYRGEGYLPNDHRHQVKLRGAYGIGEYWQVGATVNAQSGAPINAFGVGNPFDEQNYHSYFVCTANCTSPDSSERVFEHRSRGSGGRLPWTYNLGLSVSYARSFNDMDFRAKLAVYNVLDQQKTLAVDDQFEADIGFLNPEYRVGTSYQSPRYAQLLFTVDF